MIRKNSFVFSVLIVLSLLGGCKEEEPYSAAQIDPFVQRIAQTLPEKVEEGSEAGTLSGILKKEISEGAREKTAPLPTKPGDPMRTPNYDKIIEKVYAARDYKPGFVNQEGLTPAGKALLTTIENVASEALPVESFKTEKLLKDINELKELAAKTDLSELKVNQEEIAWLTSQLTGKKPSELALDAATEANLTQEFLDSHADRLKGILKRFEVNTKKINQLAANIELSFARLYLHYAFLERYDHFRSIFIHPRQDDYYNDPEIRKSRPDKAKGPYVAGNVWRKAAQVADSARNESVLAVNALTKSLEDVLASSEPEKVIAALPPQEPQYQKLVSELARYNEIVAKGGWEPISGAPALRPGSSGDKVLALKKRLAAEGYDVDTSNNRYDEQLKNAVKAYQESHQYSPTGIPQRNLWPSINVSAKDRRDQIALNVKRWRRSNIDVGKDKTFVFVNIPDFNLELWDRGKRQMRFAVVVGNNDSEIDEETNKRIWKNRTPVPLAAYIDRVIYNPYWNVTPRIREDEILPEVQKEVAKEYADLKAQYQAALGLPPVKSEGSAPSPSGESGNDIANAKTTNDILDALRNSQPSQEPRPKADPAKAEMLRQKIENFPYFNKETGEIDVSKTDPDHVPAWYARNNYEVVRMGPNWEYVRMTQGPHNALGKVKVIFPNYYDVYLHDTPAKSKFKATTRAFSHGCIRMEEPLDFAKFLLDREGKYDSENVPQILASGKYQPIFFDRKIPVFLEYYTVRVDDHGRANFLADPYDFDAKGIVYPTPPANRHLEP